MQDLSAERSAHVARLGVAEDAKPLGWASFPRNAEILGEFRYQYTLNPGDTHSYDNAWCIFADKGFHR